MSRELTAEQIEEIKRLREWAEEQAEDERHAAEMHEHAGPAIGSSATPAAIERMRRDAARFDLIAQLATAALSASPPETDGLVAALQWYADPTNYVDGVPTRDVRYSEHHDPERGPDDGAVARAALAGDDSYLGENVPAGMFKRPAARPKADGARIETAGWLEIEFLYDRRVYPVVADYDCLPESVIGSRHKITVRPQEGGKR